jgi:hypothetical protein
MTMRADPCPQLTFGLEKEKSYFAISKKISKAFGFPLLHNLNSQFTIPI